MENKNLQTFSRPTLIAEARVLSQSCLRGVCGGKVGTETRDRCFSEHLIPSVGIIPPALCTLTHHYYTGCPRRNVRDFGRVFLMLNYTDITQNIYIQSWTVTEIMASLVDLTNTLRTQSESSNSVTKWRFNETLSLLRLILSLAVLFYFILF